MKGAMLSVLLLVATAFSADAQVLLGLDFRPIMYRDVSFTNGSSGRSGSILEANYCVAYKFKETTKAIFPHRKLAAIEFGSSTRTLGNTGTVFSRVAAKYGTAEARYQQQGDKFPLFDFVSYVGYQVKFPMATSFSSINATNYTLHGICTDYSVGFYMPYGTKIELGLLLDWDLFTVKGSKYDLNQDPLQYMSYGVHIGLVSDIMAVRKFRKERRKEFRNRK